MNQSRPWPAEWTAVIGQAVRSRRKELGWSAQHLSERCAKVGHSIPRNTIANLENGRKESIPVHELTVLAEAMWVSPVELLFPVALTDEVSFLPDRPLWPLYGLLWFEGSLVEEPEHEESEALREVVRRTQWRPERWRQYHESLTLYRRLARRLDGPEADRPRALDVARAATRLVHLCEVMDAEGVARPKVGAVDQDSVLAEAKRWVELDREHLQEWARDHGYVPMPAHFEDEKVDDDVQG